MAKYLRTIEAGRYRYAYTYSKSNPRDSEQARKEKKKATSAAQKIVNEKLSRIQLTGILALNFIDSKSALFVTLTFDEAHYPDAVKRSDIRKAAEKEATNYLARLNYLAKKRKQTVKSVWVIGIGEKARYHIHIVLDGVTSEDVIACWNDKGNVDYHYLYTDKEWCAGRDWWAPAVGGANPVQIAKYLMQNGNDRPVGKHPWHASKNCKRPQQQPAKIVPDDEPVDPPQDAELLDKVDVSTIYSQYVCVEYMLPLRKSKGYHPAAGKKHKQPRR